MDEPYTPEVRSALGILASLPRTRSVGGRPKVVDEFAKGKIVALVAAGFSLRQVAGLLGITHPTVSAAIAADPELQQEIEHARQRAQLHPLACIVRESTRNWKAAVWLMKHIEEVAAKERPVEERQREAAEQSAATWIKMDMAQEIRKEASRARQRQRRQREDEEFRQRVAAVRQAKAETRSRKDAQRTRSESR